MIRTAIILAALALATPALADPCVPHAFSDEVS